MSGSLCPPLCFAEFYKRKNNTTGSQAAALLKERKCLSPLRQKASVVCESMLIWDLADWRKLVVKKKTPRGVILFSSHLPLRSFCVLTLWFQLRVCVSPLAPATPPAPLMTSNVKGSADGFLQILAGVLVLCPALFL